jgi:hypothetical protein
MRPKTGLQSLSDDNRYWVLLGSRQTSHPLAHHVNLTAEEVSELAAIC